MGLSWTLTFLRVSLEWSDYIRTESIISYLYSSASLPAVLHLGLALCAPAPPAGRLRNVPTLRCHLRLSPPSRTAGPPAVPACPPTSIAIPPLDCRVCVSILPLNHRRALLSRYLDIGMGIIYSTYNIYYIWSNNILLPNPYYVFQTKCLREVDIYYI